MSNQSIQPLRPYYTKFPKYFFRYNGKKMVIEKISDNHYQAYGDIIEDKNIQIIVEETISPANTRIDVR